MSGGGGHGGGSSRWLVSYADFITLMMVVFMVLYSMAKVDNAKFNQLKASLNASSIGTPLPVGGNPVNAAPISPGPDPASYPGGLSPVDPMNATPALPPASPPAAEPEEPETEPEPQPPSPAPAQPKPTDPMAPVRDGFRGTGAARAGSLSVELQDRGVVVSILTSVLFEEGKAELKPNATQILDEISQRLQASTGSVLVEGAPDSGLKEAPWDLATRRASAVVGYLVGAHGISAERFAVIGYGKGAGVDGLVNVVVLRKQ